MKKILVCTDLSDKSDEVLLNAEKVRSRSGAQLDVLYVSDLGFHFEEVLTGEGTFYDQFVSTMGQEVRKRVKAQMKRLGISGRAIFKEGNVTESILETVKESEEKYDLLIIGHNSQMGIFKHLLGSVAKKILTAAEVPVLISRTPIRFEKLGAFLEGDSALGWMITSVFDFYRGLHFKGLEFISLMNGEFSEVEEKIKSEVDFFCRENESPEVIVRETHELHVSSELMEQARKDGVDLAVVKRNKGKSLKKMLLGSETLRMLESENHNLLVLPV